MKKTLALTMAAVLAAGSLAGCGGGNKPAENTTAAPAATTAAAAETTTAAGTSAETSQEAVASDLSGDITVLVNNAFTNSNEPAINKAADEFMKLNPNVKVTIEGLSGSELISKYTTSAMAGAGPDVVALDNAGWPIDLAAMGLIIPLDDKIAASGNDYLQGPLDSGMYQGQYYSVPWYFNNTGLYYNKTILEDIGVANPPATWEELEDCIKKATEKGYEGLATRLDGYAIFNFFFQNDNPVIDTTGDKPVVTVNNESGKEAFNFYAGLHTKYKAFPESMKEATSWDKAYTPFVQGNCLFFICGDWAYKNIANGNPDLKFGLVPMPKGKKEAVCLGGYNLAINSNSKAQDAAWAFVQYLTSKEGDFVLTEQGRIPGRTDVDYAPILEINPDYQVFIDEAEVTVPRPRVVNAASVDEKVVDAFKKVFFDMMTPDEALAELETELNTFISENYN